MSRSSSSPVESVTVVDGTALRAYRPSKRKRRRAVGPAPLVAHAGIGSVTAAAVTAAGVATAIESTAV